MACLVQIDLNHAKQASADLLFKTIEERKIGLAVISEPYVIPDDPKWFGFMDYTAAITCWVG